MKLQLIQSQNNSKHAKQLVNYLLDHPSSRERRPKDFKDRFGHPFKNLELLMASATHHKFKLGAVVWINVDLVLEVKERLLCELLEIFSVENHSEEKEDEFFKCSV